MSSPNLAGCAVILNQQQQQNTDHCNHCDAPVDQPVVKYSQTKFKNCTVVENGRVVVKPLRIND